MNDPIMVFNLVIVVAGLVMSVLGLLQTLIGRSMENSTQKFFVILFSALCLYLVCILVRSVIQAQTGSGFAALSRIVMSGQAVLAAVLVIFLTALLLHQSGEIRWYRSIYFKIAFAIWVLYMILQIYNIFSGILFYVEDDNSYHRGYLFFVQMIPTVLIMILNLYVIWKKRSILTKRQKTAFIIYVVTPMAAMFVQTWIKGIHLIAISTVISALFMLIYIISDQTERFYIEKAENEKLKTSIMLAQIQPHFLYNSLTGIKYLCGRDPEKAQEAIGRFTEYLRHNMDSLTTDKPIDFAKELEHVKGYLTLQKLRFGDDIEVVYDLEYMDFKLPTLTLQPLVENAVTYGIRKSESGTGTVTIRTRKTESHTVEVIVEDDGPGFAVDTIPEMDDRTHIGIRNVKERIENISGGELILDSGPGKGTKAVIRIKEGE